MPLLHGSPSPVVAATGTFEAAASASQLQPAADAKLSAPLPPLQHNQQPVLHFAVSACLWGCLQRTLAPNVFLQQLGDKFARLMTQLLVRYDTWLQELVRIRQQAAAGPTAPAAAAAAPQQLPSQPPALQQQPGSGVDGGAAAAGAGAGGEARTGQAAWVPDMSLDSAAVICSDADVLKVSRVACCVVAYPWPVVDKEGIFATLQPRVLMCLQLFGRVLNGAAVALLCCRHCCRGRLWCSSSSVWRACLQTLCSSWWA